MFDAIRKFFGGDSIGNVVTDSNPRGSMESLAMTISPEQARRNLTVQAACGAVARLVSQIPFEAASPAAQAVIDMPNRHQTFPELLAGIAYDTLLYGNSFAVNLLARDRVTGIAPLDPARIRVRADPVGDPTYEDQRTGQRWTLDEITHIRDVGVGGHSMIAPSRIDSGGVRLRALIAADELILKSFDRGIHLQYIVTSDNPMSAKRSKAIAESLFELFNPKVGSRVGSGAVLGDAKLEKVPGLTPADADLRGLRRQNPARDRRRIRRARTFGLRRK